MFHPKTWIDFSKAKYTYQETWKCKSNIVSLFTNDIPNQYVMLWSWRQMQVQVSLLYLLKDNDKQMHKNHKQEQAKSLVIKKTVQCW